MVQTPLAPTEKLSKVEGIKSRSQYLREPLATELLEDTTHFTDDAVQILKFHGSYQQDNRDNRVKGQEKDYQMMLRTRTPGGYVPPQLYLTLDRLSEEYGNQTLRATTRQAFQIHGILKQNLKTVMATIINNMGSTLGACGDINRNVLAPPAPFKNRLDYQYARDYANRIADLLAPQTGAYYEIWVDGEKVVTGEEHPDVVSARKRNTHGTNLQDPVEPIYGTNYMPRKFKICVTVPGDNSIDVYTHDLSLVVITNDQEELQGFNILAGGGLGRTHNKEETFPRASDPIGYVQKEDVYDLIKAIVATQRDYGDRNKRPHARMKYLLNDWGVDKFRSKVEDYFGKTLDPFQPLPPWKYEDYLGWYEQGDGHYFYGVSITNGRVLDQEGFKLKSALREIVQKFQLPMYLTANQNLILAEIKPQDKTTVERILQDHGVVTDVNSIDPLIRYSMACPAMPTCGLAITESERALPDILTRLRNVLIKVGLPDEKIVIRMTGCPNGCARPYIAEVGFVGSFPETYQVWLGGTPHQTRLAQPYTDKMPVEELETFFEPLFIFFRDYRNKEESFGEFCHRVSFDALREFSQDYNPETYVSPAHNHKIRYRIGVYDPLYFRLKRIAREQGKSLTQLVTEAVNSYL